MNGKPSPILIGSAAVIGLFFGNAMALDFMERVFAAKSPQTARNGCYYAGVVTLIIGVSATILGIASITSVPNAASIIAVC